MIVRKIIILCILLLSGEGIVHAQTDTVNYVQTKTYLDYPLGQSVKMAVDVQYFDGLGRLKQTVKVKATPLGKDVVSHIEYDAFGRQANDYLPVPQTTTQNGNIYGTPLSNASNPTIYGTEKIYGEKTFESSPLNRVLQQKQPGTAWNTKPSTFEYGSNSATEVRKYTVTTTSWVSGAATSVVTLSGNYAAGLLYKTVVTDEDGNATTEYKNTQGQLILVRKAVNASLNADTYYVYNKFDQLVLVVPPNAVVAPTIASALDTLCYQYQYDGRNRLVAKKLPGKGWEYMVYDKQDRMVMTQDAKLGANKQWLFSKYDELGRVVYTGIYTSTAVYGLAGRLAEQTNVETKGSNNELRGSSSIPDSGADALNYSNTAYPTASIKIMTINYYDSFPRDSWFPNDLPGVILNQKVILNSQTGFAKGLLLASYVRNIENEAWTREFMLYDMKGRLIGNRSLNHLGGYTKTESELNFAGLPNQTITKHKRLTADTERMITETFTYDDQNRLKILKHKVDNRAEEILAQNDYNELSQLRNKKVGGASIASPLQSIDYAYNIRGWITKINDPTNLGGKLFGYEIRYNNPIYSSTTVGKFNGNIAEVDWKNSSEDILKRYNYAYDGINRLTDSFYAEPGAITPHNGNFDEYLTYDLNGNIQTLKRNALPLGGTTSTMIDNLEYQYIGNRLGKVIENQLNSTGYEGGDNLIDYDSNGNMINMKDKGINAINYNYLSLPDSYSITQSDPFGGVANFGLDYLYRADGVKVRKTNTSGGNRGNPTITTNITDYLDGFQYKYSEITQCTWCRTSVAFEQEAFMDGGLIDATKPITPQWVLDFVSTTEGFYSFTENRYIYQYRDHLGNVRVSYAKNSVGALEITDTNNYYPFGMNHIGGLKGLLGGYLNYKYNGKELQETGMYDYGARMYMPDLCRWGVIDPLAETSRKWGPYNYAFNNPLRFIDPDGMENQDIHILGNSAEKGLKQLQSSVDGQLTLSMDSKGKVSATAVQGATLSEAASKLLDATTNKSIDAKIQTDSDMRIDEDNSKYVGGASRGSKTDPSTGITTATNVVNTEMLGNLDKAYYGSNTGYGMLHETLETIVMAENFPNAPAATSEENNSKGYSYSHKEANRLDPRNIDPNPNWTSIKSPNFSISNGKYTEYTDSYRIQNINTKTVKEIGNYKTLKRNK